MSPPLPKKKELRCSWSCESNGITVTITATTWDDQGKEPEYNTLIMPNHLFMLHSLSLSQSFLLVNRKAAIKSITQVVSYHGSTWHDLVVRTKTGGGGGGGVALCFYGHLVLSGVACLAFSPSTFPPLPVPLCHSRAAHQCAETGEAWFHAGELWVSIAECGWEDFNVFYVIYQLGEAVLGLTMCLHLLHQSYLHGACSLLALPTDVIW